MEKNNPQSELFREAEAAGQRLARLVQKQMSANKSGIAQMIREAEEGTKKLEEVIQKKR